MDKKIIDKANKIPLSITIIIGCLILGGFYYMGELNKTSSIEKQQQIELQAKVTAAKEKELQDQKIISQKKICATSAEISAIDQYSSTCTYGCKTGYFYTANYDSYYDRCLQEYGIK